MPTLRFATRFNNQDCLVLFAHFKDKRPQFCLHGLFSIWYKRLHAPLIGGQGIKGRFKLFIRFYIGEQIYIRYVDSHFVCLLF
jgi:hypothetical protein